MTSPSILAAPSPLHSLECVQQVLFGAINPSARLPLSLPNEENEVGFTPEQYPGVYGTTTYSEEMLVTHAPCLPVHCTVVTRFHVAPP
jgi:hypothetical protein